MNKESIFAKNEKLYVATKEDEITKQLCHVIEERKKKLVQNFICF